MRATLVSECECLIKWLSDNMMQANPEKFHVLAMGAKTASVLHEITVDSKSIKCEKQAKLLGIDIYFLLHFDVQV